jgi:hypothetical protein
VDVDSNFWLLVALLGIVVIAMIANAACTTSVEIGPAAAPLADQDDK